MSLPRTGPASSIFLDARGEGRALRVTWHLERARDAGPDGEGLVVLSLWRDNVCAGSFRLAASEVPALVETLTRGITAQYDDLRTDTTSIPVVRAPAGPFGDTG